ncbi:protein DBF4 homolog B isoform X1 [Onychomys torridus]|uniref:protein DBF4 homolog B isoform X1 n=1 Tax=Onychomys torridus TaxID=38674 RepID=UPI00167FBBFD|nr:protein DBF4 homolog B isoform X1 [Onychomys torridus]
MSKPGEGAQLRLCICLGRYQKSSPRDGRQPFSGKSFDLDMPAGQNLQFLTRAIHQLSGLYKPTFLLKLTGHDLLIRSQLRVASSLCCVVLGKKLWRWHRKQPPDQFLLSGVKLLQGTRPGTESRTQKVVRLKAPFPKDEGGSCRYKRDQTPGDLGVAAERGLGWPPIHSGAAEAVRGGGIMTQCGFGV